MIKRVAFAVSSSDDDDDNDNDIDMNLSELDEDEIDKELELKDIDSSIKASAKNQNKSQSELGRIRVKLHRAQQHKKEELLNIINSKLIHPNDRLRKTQYINKQRTLIFGSRGINQRMRHLMNDLKLLIPHSKGEPKFDNKRDVSVIKEIAQQRNCNNCIFFEARRNTDLYLWFGRCPNGPSMKFFVSSVHTMDELRLTGNCLNGSRPILVFDKKFESCVEYKVMKELFLQIFGTPAGHPRSKPFIDRTLSFMILDNKIWIRNYQIVFDEKNDSNEPVLVEIGPRFVLHPIRICQGAFCGSTIYQDPHFVNPNVKRRAIKNQRQWKSAVYRKMMQSIIKREKQAKLNRKLAEIVNDDPIKDVFEKGIDF